MPLMPDPKPQGNDIAAELRAAMADAGYSRRGLAKALQRRHPRSGGDEQRGIESWRHTIGRYLTEQEERRQVPDEETAALLEQLLDRPPGFFLRQRGGVPLRQENARLKAREAELRAEIEALRREIQGLQDNAGSGGAR